VRYDDIDFLEVEDVDLAHEVALLEGGMPGTRDERLVESAVKAPQNMYATSLAEVAASYVIGIANNHGYVDGNKRTATLAMLKFLGAHGFDLDLPMEWVDIMVGVAQGTVTRGDLPAIIASLMGGDVDLEDEIPPT